MGKKTKSHSSRFRYIHTYFDIFRHIQTCSEIIQTYSEPCVTQTYSESRYIQNQKPRHNQNPVEHLWWSMLWKLLTAVVVFANYFRNISFSHCLLILIKIYFLLQKYLFHIKMYSAPGVAVNFDISTLCCNFLFIIAL